MAEQPQTTEPTEEKTGSTGGKIVGAAAAGTGGYLVARNGAFGYKGILNKNVSDAIDTIKGVADEKVAKKFTEGKGAKVKAGIEEILGKVPEKATDALKADRTISEQLTDARNSVAGLKSKEPEVLEVAKKAQKGAAAIEKDAIKAIRNGLKGEAAIGKSLSGGQYAGIIGATLATAAVGAAVGNKIFGGKHTSKVSEQRAEPELAAGRA